MIYWKISYSKQISRCSLLSKLIFTWLIPNTDDLGRMEGEPEIIKGMVFPYDEKITVKQIKESLEELSKEKLIEWYEVDENRYIQFPNFHIYQKLRADREYKSDYPSPHPLVRNCEDMNADCMTCPDVSCQVGQKMREVKGSEGEGKEKGSKPVKQLFGEKVHLTEQEHKKLVEQHGEQGTNQMIGILDNWYLLHNKKPYASDYQTMVTNGWVFKKFNEERKDKPEQPKREGTIAW